jgi:hypothetical protein
VSAAIATGYVVQKLDGSRRGPFTTTSDARRALYELNEPSAIARGGVVLQWHQLATPSTRARLEQLAREGAPANDTQPREATVTTKKAEGARCAEPGCGSELSKSKAADPELQPYCQSHRRSMARRKFLAARGKAPAAKPAKAPPFPPRAAAKKPARKPAAPESAGVTLAQAAEAVALVEAMGWPVARAIVEAMGGKR